MPAAIPPNLTAFPDSPYAKELQRGSDGPYSSPELEAEYVHVRLREGKAVIRVAAASGAAITGIRAVEYLVGNPWTLPPFGLAAVLIASLILAIIAWSSLFTRFYLPIAKILVPVRNSIAAVPIAGAAAHGQPELLMVLPLMLVGPFFFSGLNYRAALICVALTLASFIAATVAFELQLPLAVRVCVFLLATAVACAVAAHRIEQRSRTGFLESRLIAELAQLDALTGTKNRRVLDDDLARLWQQACNDGRDLAVLLIDVDYFKAYNDRYGHQAGDQALRRVAQALHRFVTGPLDVIARYGGEEFAVVLYDVGPVEACETAEQMRRAVGELGIEHRDSRCGSFVTISAGIAAIAPTLERRPRGALQLADQALYKAKSGGRNRVELLDDAQYKLLVTGVFAQPSIVRETG